MNKKFQIVALLLGAFMVLVNAPVFADRLPDWMVGQFDGVTISGAKTITLRINNQGSVRASIRERERSIYTAHASYRGDILNIDDRDYNVVRNGDGFRAVPNRNRDGQGNDRNRDDNDRYAQIFFYRVGSTNDNRQGDRISNADQSIPAWMSGRFEGLSRRNGPVIDLRIDNDGTMSATGRGSGLRSDRYPVTYRKGLFTLDSLDYLVAQSRNGFTAIATDKRNGQINFRRIGDSSNDRQDNSDDRADSRVPDWMVGRFEGRTRRNSQTINLRISSDGRITVSNRGSDRNADRVTASYRRSILTIDDRDYKVERSSDGFRANPVDDRNSQRSDRNSRIDFRRWDPEN